MTFLEFLLAKYLGEAHTQRAEGVSYWYCPVCGHESFHTLPNRPPLKHRAKCWNPDCEFRGDAADMLKEFHPDTTWSARRSKLMVMQMDWRKVVGPSE